MSTKDQIKHGTCLKEATTPLSSLGVHTQAPNRAPAPARTGSLSNRGSGAWPIGNAR